MTAASALVRLIMILIVAAALPCRAEDVISGRWEGTARVPDDELTVVVDLAQENGAWVGSIIIPGLGVKGTPLTDIKVESPDVNFAVKGPLGIRMNLRLLAPPENKLAGNFEQAGNRAPATLSKTGPPQVEYPPRSTPVAKELEGEWKGDYEMLGYTRHVSIKFANHPDGATADFVIVGRKHNVLPVDLVTQEGDLVTVDSHEMGFTFEGRLRDGNLYALDAATGNLRWKFKTGDVVHASPALADGVLFFGSWDSYFYAVDATTGNEKWRFHAGEDPLIHNQVGFQSSPAIANGVVYTGCRDANLYALDATTGKEKWRFFNDLSWVITSPAVADGKVFFATSDSSLYHVVDANSGKPIVRQQGKAYMFSSPSVAGDVVFIGVLNGTLEARDTKTGELLWDFQVDTSKKNKGWVLTADRKFNGPFLFHSSWREAPIVATDEQIRIGGIFSSPLVVNGVVYFGSADGFLYAVE